jgi:hypothetical protein
MKAQMEVFKVGQLKHLKILQYKCIETNSEEKQLMAVRRKECKGEEDERGCWKMSKTLRVKKLQSF